MMMMMMVTVRDYGTLNLSHTTGGHHLPTVQTAADNIYVPH